VSDEGGIAIRIPELRIPPSLVDNREMLERLWKHVGVAAVQIGSMLEDAAKYGVTGRFLNVRSGDLRRSIAHNVEKGRPGEELRIHVGSQDRVPYGAIHEFGGTIRPKRAKFLWIPGIHNKTATGQARSAPSDWYPFGEHGMWFHPGLLAGEFEAFVTEGKKTKHMFTLRKSVKIEGKEWLKTAIEERFAEIHRMWWDALAKFVAEEKA